ncbi:hypothetical protein LCGC14_0827940 [marine sediment metagenome]|uniref:Uncharacterized protein n=1 Tax=marine sediment metagenome TaxID=412755 RepID=A0A0F9PLI7_9ZZZZ
MTNQLDQIGGLVISANRFGWPVVRRREPRVRGIVTKQVGYRRGHGWLCPEVQQRLRLQLRQGVYVPLWLELRRQIDRSIMPSWWIDEGATA